MHWGSFSYAFGPVVAGGILALFVVILRWAHRPGASVVGRPAKRSTPDDYGVLVSIASPESYAEGEIMRRRLEDAGVRATLVFTLAGPRVMVWPEDESRARTFLTTR